MALLTQAQLDRIAELRAQQDAVANGEKATTGGGKTSTSKETADAVDRKNQGKSDEFDGGEFYYDKYGNKHSKTALDPYGNVIKDYGSSEDAIDDPEKALRDSLLNSGVDPSKIQAIIDALLANAGGSTTPPGGSVANADAAKAKASRAADAPQMDEMTFDDVNLSGVGIGNTDPTTRDVTEDELVSYQLEGLLEEDSKYIKLAKQRAMSLSNSRGQLGSSFAVGAAHRAAIESALPIATADAQAYRDAATDNMNALNEFALANIQRATALDTALLDANTRIGMANMDSTLRVSIANLEAITQIDIANLDAETRTRLGNLNAQTQLEVQKMQNEVSLLMQNREMTHMIGMEQLQQTGRVELALLDIEARELLAEMGFEHDFDMSELDHAEQMEVNKVLQQYQLERDAATHAHERRGQRANLAMQAQQHYYDNINAYKDSELDAAAVKRKAADDWNNLVAEFDMINGLFPELDPIIPKRG